MNKTVAFVSLTAGLALTALVLGLPRGDGTSSPHVVVTTPPGSPTPPARCQRRGRPPRPTAR